MKLFLILAGALAIVTAQAADKPASNGIEAEADQVLRAACDYLAQQNHFMMKAEIWRERVMNSGQKLQFTRTFQMEVQRPERFHAEVRSTYSQRGFWLDGKQLTVLDRRRNLYATAPMPSKIDDAVDKAQDDFGMDLPLIDLAMSKPYDNATAKVQKGIYLGITPVLGVDCHHLAFTQDQIDWQLWVDAGPQPVIRKFVITHKLEDGAPQFTALITHWNFADPVAKSDFVFNPPLGSSKIEMRKWNEETHRKGAKPSTPSK